MKRTSQKDRILRYMLSGKKITQAIAYEKFGCFRLSERIREIQRDFDLSSKQIRDIQKGWKKIRKGVQVREYWIE